MKRLRHPVRAIREPFGTAGLVIACVALIAALGGTAFAAAKLTSTQKKEVEKIAKKFANKPGAPGAPGANGKDGTNGASGANGESVVLAAAGSCGTPGGTKLTVGGVSKEVCNGEDGTPGSAGESVLATIVPAEPGETVCDEQGGVTFELEGQENTICNGRNGQDAGFNYAFSAGTTETDPGSGKLALNNAAAGSATVLSISETDGNSNGLAAAIAKWTSGLSSQGTLIVRKVGSPSTFAEYAVRGGDACTPAQHTSTPGRCGMTDEGSFENINVAFVAGSGTFAPADQLTITYSASGAANLPPGVVEIGSWSFTRSVEEVETEVGGTVKHEVVGDSTRILVPISLPVPLAAAIEAGKVHYSTEPGFSTLCKGTIALPVPLNSGELCVYQSELANTGFQAVYASNSLSAYGEPSTGLARGGGFLSFAKPTGDAEGAGVFAVKG